MNTYTYLVQIGNTDDKLSQYEWSCYVNSVQEAIESRASEVHFSGGSDYSAPWQNAAFVFVVEDGIVAGKILNRLKSIRRQYSQDSIAWTKGETEFV